MSPEARSGRRSPARGLDRDRIVAGRRPVLELLRAGGPIERIFLADSVASAPVIAEIRRRAREAAVPLRVVPRSELAALGGDTNHQGVLALAARFHYAALEVVLREPSLGVLFLDGVTDPQNLGSLLRSAEVAGFDGVVIPAHRSAAVTAAVRRVSAGAAEIVPVVRVPNLGRAVEEARTAGLWMLGLAHDADDVLWSTTLADPPVGLVLGAEDRGISKHIRAKCDGLARIPQGGSVGSLNVAVAGAVAMFEVVRRKTDGH